MHILSCFSGISSSLVTLQGDLVAHCPLVGALGNDCFSCFSSSSRERYPPNSRLKKLKKMVEHGFNKESASVHSVLFIYLFYLFITFYWAGFLQLPRGKGHKRTSRSYSKVPHLTHPPIRIHVLKLLQFIYIFLIVSQSVSELILTLSV